MELTIPLKDVDVGPSLFHGPHPFPHQPKQKPGQESPFPLTLQPILHVSAILPPTRLRHWGAGGALALVRTASRLFPLESPEQYPGREPRLGSGPGLPLPLWRPSSGPWLSGLGQGSAARAAPGARLTHVVLHQLLHRVKLSPRRDVVATRVQLSDLVMLHMLASGLVPIPDGQGVGTCWEGSPGLPQSGSRKRPRRLGTLELEGHTP